MSFYSLPAFIFLFFFLSSSFSLLLHADTMDHVVVVVVVHAVDHANTWINTYNPYPWYIGEFGLGAVRVGQMGGLDGIHGQIRWMLLVVLWVLV